MQIEFTFFKESGRKGKELNKVEVSKKINVLKNS
jgi:hypothetical protein